MGNALRWKSLRMRLLLGLLLGLIPLIGIWMLVYTQSARDLRAAMAKSAEREHAQLLELVRERLGSVEAAARSLSQDPWVQQLLELSPSELSATAEQLREYAGYALRREQEGRSAVAELCLQQLGTGRSYCYGSASPDTVTAGGTAWQQPVQKNPVGDPAVAGPAPGGHNGGTSDQQGITNGEAASRSAQEWLPVPNPGALAGAAGSFRIISPGSTSPTSNQGQIQYALPVTGTSSIAPVGTVVVKVNLETLIASPLNRGNWANRYITDGQGQVLYAAKPVHRLAAPGEKENESSVLFQYRDLSFTSYLQLPASGLQSAVHPIRWLTGAVAGLLLILVIGVSAQLSFLVVRPLRQLRLLMKRAERGDLKAYWVSSGSLELNELGESYNQMLNRLEDLIRRVKEEEGLKKEAEIEALHYQLNPHFLYNTLNTIKWVAKIHKTPQIADAVNALVRLLQASVGKKGDFITVREELSLVQDYMAIQSFRYGEKTRLELQVDSEAETCLVPRLLLQPLVENAIIHGIEPSRKEGRITVRIWIDRDLLFCQVSDNGVGLSEERQAAIWNEERSGNRRRQQEGGGLPVLREAMSGIGLRNIRDRIRLYYGADYKMQMQGKPAEGTTVRLTLPVHQSEGEAG